MAETTVGELAKSIGAPIERLLKQMAEAGLPHKSAEENVSDAQKQLLLTHLKAIHGVSSNPEKVNLQRKTTTTLTPGKRKTVNVEVRKKRTYVNREDADPSSKVSLLSGDVKDLLLSGNVNDLHEIDAPKEKPSIEVDIQDADSSPQILSSDITKEDSIEGDQLAETLVDSIYTATNFSHSESPSNDDKLNRINLVDSLAINLLHKENKSHRTIGLLGDWGSGKSTFLNLLKMRLKKSNSEQDFIFGEFNAWAYEHSENIQAGIAQEMINALTSRPEVKGESEDDRNKKLKKLIVSLKWFWMRSNLTFQFSCKANSVQLLKIGALLFIASMPWVFGSLKKILDFSVSQPLSGWGYLIWLGGFGLYISRELGRLMMNPQAKELLTYMRLPNYAKHLGKVPIMRKNIRIMAELRLKEKNGKSPRLLFLVDDLDRCSPEAIVKVLEAVRLALELDNVIVIIAIDQQIALAALASHYNDFSQHHKLNNAHAIARDYLAKIIHLPIVLKKPTASEVGLFMNYLWESDGSRLGVNGLSQTSSVEVDGSLESLTPLGNGNFREDLTASNLEAEDILVDARKEIKSLSYEQKESFVFWVNYFRLSNTRQLKRLNNSYDLIRSFLPGKDLESIEFDGAEGVNVFPMLLTLILMEYINNLGDRILRKSLWSDLFIAEEGSVIASASPSLSEKFIVGYRKLRRENNDVVEQVESFVLPAVD